MPADPQGWAKKLADGTYAWQYRDVAGDRQTVKTSTGKTMRFKSRSAGRAHFRDHVLPALRGDRPDGPEHTLATFVEFYLDTHVARARTIGTLRERLAHATAKFGDVPLRDLENMTGEIAAWYKRQPEGSRYGRLQAFRQCCGAAIRWKHMTSNPALEATKNRQPPPREIRVYTLAELDTLTEEMPATYRGLPHFAAGTGLRTEEWAALDARRDIDRAAGLVYVHRTVTGGKTADDPLRIVELGKTDASHREVPLTARAAAALDTMPPRIGLLFPAPAGGPLNLDNWRRRTWAPAVEASGIDLPARPYDTRSTYASKAIGAGVELFELARVMGTSTRMIEKHYGRLLGGARASIAARLDAADAAEAREAAGAEDRPAEGES
jgi:hypothetical protein